MGTAPDHRNRLLETAYAAKGTDLASLFQSGFTPERLVPISLRTRVPTRKSLRFLTFRCGYVPRPTCFQNDMHSMVQLRRILMEHAFARQSSYSVGHRMLDQQHRELFRLCKQATDCARGNLPAAAFTTIINDPVQRALKHIDNEESVLLKCGYSQLDEHKEDHLRFVKTITDLMYAAMYGTADKSAVADYVLDWWKSHVLDSDMKFRDAVLTLGAGSIHAVAIDESFPSRPLVKR